jgi:L-2-hydroxyglutarate oxidase LhgO
VVGAGILGLAISRRLQQVHPGAQVTVLEKEAAVGQGQTGHNSGVVHAGIYYPDGSLKAQLCRRGSDLLRRYAQERGLPFDACGKLVVAADEQELAGLREFQCRPGGLRRGPPANDAGQGCWPAEERRVGRRQRLVWS